MKYKIGQKIKFTNSFTINASKGKKFKVCPGDEAMIVRKIDNAMAEVVYTKGQAKGLSQNLDIEVDDGLDEDGIAKKIMQELYK